MTAHDVPIRVDHVGIAIDSIETGEPFLEALGCEKILEEPVDDEFKWAYYELGDASRIELIAPIAEETFLTNYLEEHGPGLHHVTLEVGDIDRIIEALQDAGIRVVDYTERADWTEAFVSPANPTGTLFQLMEYHDSYVEQRNAEENPCIGGARIGRD